jgi:hypothetical protein
MSNVITAIFCVLTIVFITTDVAFILKFDFKSNSTYMVRDCEVKVVNGLCVACNSTIQYCDKYCNEPNQLCQDYTAWLGKYKTGMGILSSCAFLFLFVLLGIQIYRVLRENKKYNDEHNEV